MADKKKNISREELEAYHSQKMNAKEMHALEKRALDSAFESEVIEGLDEISASELQTDLKALDQKLKASVQKTNWTIPLRIAAGLALLASVTWVIYFLNEKNFSQNDIALNEQAETDDAPLQLEKFKEQIAEDIVPQAKQETQTATTEEPAKHEVAKDEIAPKKTDTEVAIAEDIAGITEVQVATEESHQTRDLAAAENAAAKRSTLRVTGAVATIDYAKKKVKGRVTSAEDGTPLPGVNVTINGTTTGTITDPNGEYEIETSQTSEALIFSFIGLKSKEEILNNKNQLDVQMEADVTSLSEIVVTGYGYSTRDNINPTFELASPSIGKKAYQQYLESNARYPEEAAQTNTSGRVVLDITIAVDGSISNYEIVRSLGKACDDELIRLVKEGPTWRPSSENGVPFQHKVRIRLKFPTRK